MATYDAEGCTTGVELTTGNQGATALLISKLGATPSFQAASTGTVIRGTKSYLVAYGATGDTVTLYETNTGNTTQKKVSAEFYFASAPTVDFPLLTVYATTGGGCATAVLRTTGRVAMQDSAGTSVYVTPNDGTGIVTFPRTFTIDCTVDIGTSITTGKFKMDVYLNDLSLVNPWCISGEFTGLDLFKSGAIASIRTGKLSGLAVGSHRFDTLKIADGYGLQGAFSVASMPLTAIITSTGWSLLAGTTFIANLSDTDPLTGATSPANPTNAPLGCQMPGIIPPGGDFQVTVDGYRGGGATSGSVSATLYEGATLRATSNSQTLNATSTSVTLTFLAANLAGISSGAWQAGLELRLLATAA